MGYDEIKSKLMLILPFLLVIVAWELFSLANLINVKLLPSPSMIFIRLFEIREFLLNGLINSFSRMIAGYVLGISFGVIFGILTAMNKIADFLLSPVFALLISVPTLAYVPLLLIILGPTETTVIFSIFLGCFFVVYYNTNTGIKSVDKRLIWLSETMKIDKFRVVIPASLVFILTGLRLAVGYSWRALVGAEMLTTGILGLGKMIYAARAFNNLETMFVGLFVIGLCGLFLDKVLLDYVQKKTVKKWGFFG